MYSFYIDGDDIKTFMNELIKGSSFDKFEVRGCDITTFVTYSIDGRLNKSWFEEDTERFFCKWSELKPYVFSIIKGNKKPKSMKIVLALNEKASARVHPNGKACFINIVFEEERVAVVTGTAQIEFSLDKSLDEAWEERVKGFFKKMNIVQNTG